MRDVGARIALGQLKSGFDKQKNLEAIAVMTAEAALRDADLIVFPELAMFEVTQGVSAAAEAEALDGPFPCALASLASTHRLTVLAGMVEAIPGSREVFNTIVAFGPDGNLIGAYRKVHLYDAFGFKESDIFQAGSGEMLLFTLKSITFGVQTCYDVRFPEMTRALVDQGADCILTPAAWLRGLLKESHWEILLRARAIENTVFVAGAGLIGPRHCGGSMLVDPMGVAVARAGEVPALVVGEVSQQRLAEARDVNPSLANRRPDIYRTWSLERVPSGCPS